MRAKREHVAIIGAGAATCAVCCAGPVVGFLAAIGLGTALGVAVFGSIALLLGAVAVLTVLHRRNRRSAVCTPGIEATVELSAARRR